MKNDIFPRFQDILFLAVFLAALLLGPRMLNMDGDLPRHMAIGRYVLQGNLPPVNDIFSHTVPGAPFAPHKWLSGVLFYLAYLLFDERGMVLLSATALAATFTIIYVHSVARAKVRLPVFLLAGYGAVLTSLHWIVRPHIFTMLLFALWLVLTDKLSRGERVSWWYFPALMLLWNNIHGEYLAGFLITGAYLAGWVWDFLFEREKTPLETGKRLTIAAALSALVTLLNPVSVRAWGTVTGWLGNEYLMARTDETVPPNFAEPKFLILLAFLSLSIFLLAIKREKLQTGAAIALAGFTAMTLTSARNIHFYGVIAPFLLAPTLTGSLVLPLIKQYEALFEKVESSTKGILWPIFTVLLGILLLMFSPLREAERFSPAFFPVQAVQWLKENPQEGEMFNPFDWGGYLSFYLPEKKVFIDSQGDVYGEAFIRKYEKVITLAPGWQNILDEYNVRWALVNADWPLARALAKEGWQEIYRDGTAVILRRGGE
ncbi:MAG: hypothetical protein NZP74_04965 [Anaerolineales bacterium]|nr:hypothetical protein [Anaerolineales bacterium]MDW8278822.1 hypothetical protein [Anaerolineales bacterium]